jgi:hypothetical protein
MSLSPQEQAESLAKSFVGAAKTFINDHPAHYELRMTEPEKLAITATTLNNDFLDAAQTYATVLTRFAERERLFSRRIAPALHPEEKLVKDIMPVIEPTPNNPQRQEVIQAVASRAPSFAALLEM